MLWRCSGELSHSRHEDGLLCTLTHRSAHLCTLKTECPTALLPSEVLSTVSYNYTAGSFAEKIANLKAETAAMFQMNSVDSAYAVAVIHRNATVFMAGDVATPFRIGSVTKVFTAMAALLLRHQGRLSLDDPVKKFLPSFSVINPYDGAAITLRALMAHVSGLPRELCAKVYDCGDLVAEKDILESIAQMELVRPPWSFLPIYSNLGFSVLGHAWEKATSPPQSWSEYIKDQILTPLKMNDMHRRRFCSCSVGSRKCLRIPFQSLNRMVSTCRYSTALDLAKFLKFLMNPQPELLSASVSREWTRTATVFPDSARVGFALPWEILTVTTSGNVSVPIVTKSGGLGSYVALVAFDAATELGVAVLVSDTVNYGSVENDFVKKVLGDLIPEVSSMNTEILASLYSGVYVCNRSEPVVSRYRHVGFPVDVGENNVNKTLQVIIEKTVHFVLCDELHSTSEK